MREVEIRHVGSEASLVAAGALRDGVAAYWWGFEQHGEPVEQLSFLLVDEGFLLSQPVGFPPTQRGWWYCDLVDVERDGELISFRDMFVDVIVGPPDHPYRVLDLDEYADAVTDGRLAAAQGADGLRRCQAFLDRHLNRRHEVDRSWPDFPPAGVTAFDPAVLPRNWRWTGDPG